MLIVSGVAAVVGAIFLALGSSTIPSSVRHAPVTRFSPKSHEEISNDHKFMEAIKDNDMHTMRYLLREHVVSARGRNQYGRGWLQYATFNGSVAACTVLLEYGASPTVPDDIGQSAIDLAKSQGKEEILAILASVPASKLTHKVDE